MRVNGGASSSDVSCSIGSCLFYVSAQTPVTLTDIVRYFSISSGQIVIASQIGKKTFSHVLYNPLFSNNHTIGLANLSQSTRVC